MKRSGDPEALIRCLTTGGVALMATDTMPGLHARIDTPAAVARIQALKGRDAGKPLLVLAASLEAAAPWLAERPARVDQYIRRCWPGPFTLVLKASAAASRAVTGGRGTLAVRVPQPPALREALLQVGVPIVSTSANAAGELPAPTLLEAAEAFGERVDLVSDLAWSPVSQTLPVPSTLVDLTLWPPVVLRPGEGIVPDWSDIR